MKQEWNFKIDGLKEVAKSMQKAEELIAELKTIIKDLQIGMFHAEPTYVIDTERIQETETVGNIKLLLGQAVFIVDKNFEYCEAAHIKKVIHTDQGTVLRLQTILGRTEFREKEELGKTIFFTKEKALAALKVDENGNPIETYLTKFIKHFPEYQSKEQEVIDVLCRYQVFELQDCPDYMSGKSPAECEACWNRPYKEENR